MSCEIEGRERERMEQIPLFNEKMKLAQKAAMAKRWEDFKKIMKDDQENLLKQFDLFENSAIHVATRSNSPRLLRELIEMLPKEERWQALCKENREGNTVLHEVVFCKKKKMADVVFEIEDELLLQQQSSSLEEKRTLLNMRNHRGETPLFMAAMHGKLKMLKHMTNHIVTHNMGDIKEHSHRSDKNSALHASVIGQHLGMSFVSLRLPELISSTF